MVSTLSPLMQCLFPLVTRGPLPITASPPFLFLLFLAQVWGATCPRAAMGRIDVSSDDRGLGACFEAAHITADWRGLYVSHHKVVTLDDYIYMIDSTAWEKSLESHLQQVTGLRDNRIALARFKSMKQACKLCELQPLQTRRLKTLMSRCLTQRWPR